MKKEHTEYRAVIIKADRTYFKVFVYNYSTRAHHIIFDLLLPFNLILGIPFYYIFIPNGWIWQYIILGFIVFLIVIKILFAVKIKPKERNLKELVNTNDFRSKETYHVEYSGETKIQEIENKKEIKFVGTLWLKSSSNKSISDLYQNYTPSSLNYHETSILPTLNQKYKSHGLCLITNDDEIKVIVPETVYSNRLGATRNFNIYRRTKEFLIPHYPHLRMDKVALFEDGTIIGP
ncbi:MAG: hypothetical protein GPJ54_00270 [Candidatus Heimdallarchaeota archaeon]|nr:hypothetical protein [Candidatus Heimdallarchaeota archaeon]